MFSGDQLKRRRQERQLSQADLARQLNIARSSYYNWETGKTQPNQANLEHLAKLLLVTPDYFDQDYRLLHPYHQLQSARQDQVVDFTDQLLEEQKRAQAPKITALFAYKVYEKLSAGTGYGYFEDRSYDTVFHTEKIDHDLASWVYGDSMEPLYLNGSVALIKDTGFDYDGGIYAVDWDGQTYLKRVYREAEGLRLVSLNQKYQDKFAPYSEEPRIIGKLVGNFMPVVN